MLNGNRRSLIGMLVVVVLLAMSVASSHAQATKPKPKPAPDSGPNAAKKGAGLLFREDI